MKYLFSLLVFLLLSFTAADPIKIVFFGDSITQMGVQPKGYVSNIQEYIEKKSPGKYEAIGAGIGGNKIYDLYLRFDEMLQLQPSIVVFYIGVNDVWHKSSFGTGTDPDRFVRFYEKMIEKLQVQNIKVILVTPAVIGEKTDFSNAQDGDLNEYSKMVRSMATKYKLDLVDLRSAFLDYNLKNNPKNLDKGILTTDRVHLNDKGNQLVSDLIINALFK